MKNDELQNALANRNSRNTYSISSVVNMMFKLWFVWVFVYLAIIVSIVW